MINRHTVEVVVSHLCHGTTTPCGLHNQGERDTQTATAKINQAPSPHLGGRGNLLWPQATPIIPPKYR